MSNDENLFNEKEEDEKVDKLIKAEEQNYLPATKTVQPLTKEIIRQHNDIIKYVVENEMKAGVHFGIIPGTKQISLLKPGADLLKRTFNLLDHYDVEVIDEQDQHRTYDITCNLSIIGGDGKVFATGSAIASTLESKFRYENVYKNNQYQGKEEIPIEKRPDKWHNVRMIGKKRAFVAAVNSFFAPSGYFTEDLEDENLLLGKDRDKKPKNKNSKNSPSDWKDYWDDKGVNYRFDEPAPGQRDSYQWYIDYIKKIDTPRKLSQFIDVFSIDIKFMDDDSTNKIHVEYKKRIEELKNKVLKNKK